MTSRVAVLLVGLGLALAACTSETPVPRGRLFPLQRLLEARPPSLPAEIVWGGNARIAGETRLGIMPTIGVGDLVPGTPPDVDSPHGRWSVQIPEALRAVPWLLVRAVIVKEHAELVTLPARLVDPHATGPVLLIDAGDPGALAGIRVLVAIVPAAPLATYDVTGPAFVVPAGAVATAGMGIDEATWDADAAPVELRLVVVEDGRETIVHRTVLDPSRRLEDRRWVDARADLGAFAGRRVQLGLRAAATDPARPGTSLPIWADPVVLAPRATHAPNVILMSLDTLRAKSVSAYGASRPTTPSLDRLVGDAGTVFDTAYTTAPHTLPAHLSTFTGLWARELYGVNPLGHLPADVATLPERLRAAGYETGAFTEDGFIIPSVGFLRGFTTYCENASPNFHEPLGQSAKTFRAAADWLATRRDRPTFLFVHTYEVHFPYTPAPPYDTAFGAADDQPSDNARDLLRYEQEARHLDDEIRAFLDTVDGLGLGTQTLLVVMGDHGEEFLEHGAKHHGLQVYDETVHVPLMMRLPGVVPAGLRVATPVSLVDVLPTILDLVAAPPLVGIDGASLVPLMSGGTLPEWRRAVFSEANSSLITNIDLLSVRTPALHCVYRTRTGTSQCFDPTVDPEEKTPVLTGDAALTLAREEAVHYWSLRGAAPPATAPAELVQALSKGNDAERIEKLRALGYVE